MREEYNKLCLQYGREEMERLFAGLKGYKQVRKEHKHKIVLEEVDNYFKTF